MYNTKKRKVVGVHIMARNNDGKLDFQILADFGAFGDGKWQKHLTFT